MNKNKWLNKNKRVKKINEENNNNKNPKWMNE